MGMLGVAAAAKLQWREKKAEEEEVTQPGLFCEVSLSVAQSVNEDGSTEGVC